MAHVNVAFQTYELLAPCKFYISIPGLKSGVIHIKSLWDFSNNYLQSLSSLEIIFILCRPIYGAEFQIINTVGLQPI